MKTSIGIAVLTATFALAGCKDEHAADHQDAGVMAPVATPVATATPRPAAGTATTAAGGGAMGGEMMAGERAAAIVTGAPACDEYLRVYDEITAKCRDKMGATLASLQTSRDAQVEAFKQWPKLDEATRKSVIEASIITCTTATAGLRASADSVGCKL